MLLSCLAVSGAHCGEIFEDNLQHCLPWKIGKYKSCYHNCYASIKVDEEPDVTLHLLQVSIVHAFHHGTKQEGDSHLGEKEIIFNLYSSHPKCIEHLSY